MCPKSCNPADVLVFTIFPITAMSPISLNPWMSKMVPPFPTYGGFGQQLCLWDIRCAHISMYKYLNALLSMSLGMPCPEDSSGAWGHAMSQGQVLGIHALTLTQQLRA